LLSMKLSDFTEALYLFTCLFCHYLYLCILSLQKLANLGPGQYQLKGFVDDWDTIHRKRQGRFGKVNQYPEKPTERVFCKTLSQCPKEAVCWRCFIFIQILFPFFFALKMQIINLGITLLFVTLLHASQRDC